MSTVALRERIGKVLRLVETGGEAEIVRSYRVSGDFPKHRSIQVTFDFARKEDGTDIVYLSRATGGKTNLRKSWTLTEVIAHDWVKSEGVRKFSESIGILPSQLGNLIAGFKPVD
jgi:hypothetical protein